MKNKSLESLVLLTAMFLSQGCAQTKVTNVSSNINYERRVGGFFRVPTGGDSGTGSEISWKEAGLENAMTQSLNMKLEHRNHNFDVEYKLANQTGESTLTKNTMFKGIQFPKGTDIEIEYNRSEFNLIYSHDNLITKGFNENLTMIPYVGLYWEPEHKTRITGGGKDITREYSTSSAFIGTDFNLKIHKWCDSKLQLDLNMDSKFLLGAKNGHGYEWEIGPTATYYIKDNFISNISINAFGLNRHDNQSSEMHRGRMISATPNEDYIEGFKFLCALKYNF